MNKNDMVWAGLRRSPQYSPHSCERDAAIFREVERHLREAGRQVMSYDEDEWTEVQRQIPWDRCCGVFSMARHPHVLHGLAERERQGLPVFNSPTALLTLSRSELTVRCARAGVPVPHFVMVSTDVDASTVQTLSAVGFPLWLKRSEACAQVAADVSYAGSTDEALRTLRDFSARGIRQVMAVAHCPGDLVKFYGVGSTSFFHIQTVNPSQDFSKFGLEAHNGTPQGFHVKADALHAAADCASRATNILVYGGDAVISGDGTFRIIDFNDWPSFNSCRDEAGRMIARALLNNYEVTPI